MQAREGAATHEAAQASRPYFMQRCRTGGVSRGTATRGREYEERKRRATARAFLLRAAGRPR